MVVSAQDPVSEPLLATAGFQEELLPLTKEKEMSPTRRDFVRSSLVAGGSLALGTEGVSAAMGPFGEPSPAPAPEAKAPRSLKLLILGGTSFLGPYQVHHALERGHEVTIFTRGQTQPTIHSEDFKRVEHLIGDREDDLSALEGREWDAVLDNSTRKWEWTRDSAALLKDAVGQYLFISSTGVYYPYLTTNIDESVQPLSVDESEGKDGSAGYGVMKTLGEMEAQKHFGDRAIIARPQHFTGPGETTDRHNFWVERMERGGEVLAMGRRTDPVMLMDVRDLAAFNIHLLETEAGGVFNIAGPASLMTQEQFLHGLRFCTGASVDFTWVDDYEFLKEHLVHFATPWVLLEGRELGYTSINIDKAVAHGLTFRSLAETHLAVRDWWLSDKIPSARREDLRFPLSAEREAEVLAAWKGR
jgi:2'-hydroxyisoflavone reductase